VSVPHRAPLKRTLPATPTPFSHSRRARALAARRHTISPCPDLVQLVNEEEETPPLAPEEEQMPEELWSHSLLMPKVKEETLPLCTPFHCLPPPSGYLGEDPMLHRPCRAKPRRKRTTEASSRLRSDEPSMAPLCATRRLPPRAVLSCRPSILFCKAKIRRGHTPSAS
jgi:hypothetical protein